MPDQHLMWETRQKSSTGYESKMTTGLGENSVLALTQFAPSRLCRRCVKGSTRIAGKAITAKKSVSDSGHEKTISQVWNWQCKSDGNRL